MAHLQDQGEPGGDEALEALQVAAKVASSTRVLGSFPRAEAEDAMGDR